MNERSSKIATARLRQSEEELKRKADKASCRSYYTQEDFDHAHKWAERMAAELFTADVEGQRQGVHK